jgi:hypothetical protein
VKLEFVYLINDSLQMMLRCDLLRYNDLDCATTTNTMTTPPSIQPPSSSSDRTGKDYEVITSPLDESLLYCNRWKCVYCHRTIWRQSRFLPRVDSLGEKKTASHTCGEKEYDRLQKARQSGVAAVVPEERAQRNNWKYLVGVLSFVSVAAVVSLGVVIGSGASKGPSPGPAPTASSTLSPSGLFTNSSSGDSEPPSTSPPSIRAPSSPPVSVRTPTPTGDIITDTPTLLAVATSAPTLLAVATATPTLLASAGPTLAPSTIASTTRPTYFKSGLPPYSLEIAENDPSSPQAKALAWLQDDPLFDEYELYRLNQRYALAVLYYSTEGESSWTNSSGWLSNLNECDWYTASSSDICAEGSRLVALELEGLAGSVPTELELIVDLESIVFPLDPELALALSLAEAGTRSIFPVSFTIYPE